MNDRFNDVAQSRDLLSLEEARKNVSKQIIRPEEMAHIYIGNTAKNQMPRLRRVKSQ